MKNLTRTVFLQILLMCATLQATSPAISKERFFNKRADSEMLYQPVHPDTGLPLHDEGANAI